MRFPRLLTKLGCVAALTVVAGCSGTFRTFYPEPVPAAQSATWRLSSVNVTAPRSLKVSEAETYLPQADIVWREDPAGNRYEQVETIMRNAITTGARGLQGARPVTIDVTMSRFHAMTFVAETRAPGGVHNIDFTLAVHDARTGELLFGPEPVEASFPALTGEEMARARLAGQSQKSQITAHVAQTIRGLLGLGPDVRQSFTEIGG